MNYLFVMSSSSSSEPTLEKIPLSLLPEAVRKREECRLFLMYLPAVLKLSTKNTDLLAAKISRIGFSNLLQGSTDDVKLE